MEYKWNLDEILKTKLQQLGCQILENDVVKFPSTLLFNIINTSSSTYKMEGYITKITGNKKCKIHIRVPHTSVNNENKKSTLIYTIYK